MGRHTKKRFILVVGPLSKNPQKDASAKALTPPPPLLAVSVHNDFRQVFFLYMYKY